MFILEWLVKIILNMILDRAVKGATEAYDASVKEKERGETNAKNAADYLAAQDRVDAVKAALNLLNGTKPK